MRLPSHLTIFLFLFIGLGALMCTWTEVLRWAYNAEFPRRRKFFLHPTRWPTLLGIAFFDAVITDARESTIGSFAEATLAGSIIISIRREADRQSQSRSLLIYSLLCHCFSCLFASQTSVHVLSLGSYNYLSCACPSRPDDGWILRSTDLDGNQLDGGAKYSYSVVLRMAIK